MSLDSKISPWSWIRHFRRHARHSGATPPYKVKDQRQGPGAASMVQPQLETTNSVAYVTARS